MKQTNLFDYYQMAPIRKQYGRTTHGGTKTKGHRKMERPFSSKKWMHLVLKSHLVNKPEYRSQMNFLNRNNKFKIDEIIHKYASKFGVKIAEYVNMGNHLHLKIKSPNRIHFKKFLRAVTAMISRTISGAKKGNAFGSIWQGLPYTRVLMSSFEELGLKGYFKGNLIEKNNGYKQREEFLKSFNQWLFANRKRNKTYDILPSLSDTA